MDRQKDRQMDTGKTIFPPQSFDAGVKPREMLNAYKTFLVTR